MRDILEKGPCGDPDCVLSVPCYQDHVCVERCVREAMKWPLPLALYIDGVRCTPICAGRYDNHVSHTTPKVVMAGCVVDQLVWNGCGVNLEQIWNGCGMDLEGM
eukprot:7559381-Pyramimonas_sp.AAC.1